MAERTLTGRIAREKIAHLSVPRPPAGAVEGFLALGDCTGVVADVMDELGLASGVVGAHLLKPTIGGTVLVGPALTIRNVALPIDPLEGARQRINKMAEYEAHNLATPGDVLVIEGVSGCSNLGGMSAQTGKRQGEAGAIVMGGVRDVAHSRSVGFPVWASELTALTGKWRLETVEINGEVTIAGVTVACGDLVIADDTSVVFVPRANIAEVLALAQKKAAAEVIRCQAIDDGLSVVELIRGSAGGKST
jgi:4-hydroxy-4-methyl-2-oxoglutarate aldolase